MLTLVTPPAAIFTPDNLKLQLRLDDNTEDALIDNYIASATAYLDGPHGRLNQALMTQTWLWKTPCFASPLRLPFGPVQSVAWVKYMDASGVEQTLSSANYYLFADAVGPYIKLVDTASWPSIASRDDAVRVQFTAGMGAASDIPADIKQFIRVMVAEQHMHREIGVADKVFPSGFDPSEWVTRHRRSF